MIKRTYGSIDVDDASIVLLAPNLRTLLIDAKLTSSHTLIIREDMLHLAISQLYVVGANEYNQLYLVLSLCVGLTGVHPAELIAAARATRFCVRDLVYAQGSDVDL